MSKCPSVQAMITAKKSRPKQKPYTYSNNAARERSRVRALRSAFLQLQQSLPAVPPGTKLSKLDVLVLATAYICHLTQSLQETRHAITCQKGIMDNQQMPAKSKSQTSQSQIVNTFKGCDNNLTTLCLILPQRKTFVSSINDSQTKDFATEKNQQKNGCLKIFVDPVVGHMRTFEKKKVIEKNVTYYDSVGTNDKRLEAQLSKVKLGASSHPSENKVSLMVGRNSKSFNSTMMATLHPVKKWPMRSRLYESLLGSSEAVSTLLPKDVSTN